MNCKPNELAFIKIPKEFGLNLHLNDKIVTTVQLVMSANFKLAWIVDNKNLTCNCGCNGYIENIPDEYLRPIRGTDGEDEMLKIAGKPKVVENV